MRCWSCGSTLPEEARFCVRCGLSQDDKETLPLYVVDAETGLFNLVFLQALVDHELTRAWRHRRPLSVLAVEADLGESSGRIDRPARQLLVQELAAALKRVMRDTDTVGHLEGPGGPRFGILLPETDWRGAVSTANKIRRDVGAQRFDSLPGQSLTLSCGVASFDVDALVRQNLLQLAVMALEAGRAAGPNRIHAPRI